MWILTDPMSAHPIPCGREKNLDSDGASHTNTEQPQTITQQFQYLSHALNKINKIHGEVNTVMSNMEKKFNDANVLVKAKSIQDQQRRERIRRNMHKMPPIIQIDPMHPKMVECIMFVLQDSINSITNNYYCIKENNIPGICDLIISLCVEWTQNVTHSAWKCMKSLGGKKLEHDISILEDRPKQVIHDMSAACHKLKDKKNQRGFIAKKSLTSYIANEIRGAGEKTVKDLLFRLCVKGCCKPQTFIRSD